jgi:hypothetical protein
MAFAVRKGKSRVVGTESPVNDYSGGCRSKVIVKGVPALRRQPVGCEVIGRAGFIMYSIIEGLNATLYALVGYVVESSRKQLSSPSGEQEPRVKS